MNSEPTNNGELNKMVDNLAQKLADETDDKSLSQLLSALDIALIHPHHINRYPCKKNPAAMRILIRTGLRHLLWNAYDQVHTINQAQLIVRRIIIEMLKQNNDEELSLRLYESNKYVFTEPAEEADLAA